MNKYLDTTISINERVEDLISLLTLEEKAGLLFHESEPVNRLGIPAMNWWNEALHGVARAGVATVFPQAIGIASTWNEKLMQKIADIISTEGRAKYNNYAKQGSRGYYRGLTFWSPNVNIFRDPHWGRGHETYGECPYLTSRMGVAFCKGIQGYDKKYLKAAATPKHFAVHSGPEGGRANFNARVNKKDFYETYLFAFHACFTESKAVGAMSAYNAINGVPCSADKLLLTDILRDQWGFTGHVVSDAGAISNMNKFHKNTKDMAESIALAIKAGCDIMTDWAPADMLEAVHRKILTEKEIDEALRRTLAIRFRLGQFDNEFKNKNNPYESIPYAMNDCQAHKRVAYKAALESVVLLKNDGILPIDISKYKNIAVIGPNAERTDLPLGNYNGTPSEYYTLLDGVRKAAGSKANIYYSIGCNATGSRENAITTDGYIPEALAVSEMSDLIILAVGLNPGLEGEDGDASNPDTTSGDKKHLKLTGLQNELINAMLKTKKPIIVVNISGSAVLLNEVDKDANAVLQQFYPGQAGGIAIADILFGKHNPAGRLPLTFYKSQDDIPPFKNYSMKGRTYRYFSGDPLYSFGFGLSYSDFEYSNLKLSSNVIKTGQGVTVTVDVKNNSKIAGDEVIQIYLSAEGARFDTPIFDLRSFTKVNIKAGETKNIKFKLSPRDLSLINNNGERVILPINFKIYAYGSCPDKTSVKRIGKKPLSALIKIEGKARKIKY